MTLTFGRSPFGHQRGSYNVGALPDHIAYAEPWPRRMLIVFGNRTVLDSRNADIEGLVIIDHSSMDRLARTRREYPPTLVVPSSSPVPKY